MAQDRVQVWTRRSAEAAWTPVEGKVRVVIHPDGGMTITVRVASFSDFAVTTTANAAPTVQGTLPAQTLGLDGEKVRVDVARFFADPDDPVLTYTATSSAEEIVAVQVTGSELTLTGVAEGQATITVTATDPDGARAAQTLAVTVLAMTPAEAQQRFARLNREILAWQGLTLSDQTSRALARRLSTLTPGTPEIGSYTLGGHTGWAQLLQATLEQGAAGRVALKPLLGQSAFVLPLRDHGTGLERLTLWGSGHYTHVQRDGTPGLAWDGEMVGAQVGADLQVRPDLLAGMAVSWADGGFAYQDRGALRPAQGTYDTWLVSVQPYLGWRAPNGLGLWATLGYGWGELAIEDPHERVGQQASALRLRTAALGAKGPLLSRPGGTGTTTLQLKSDAAFVQVAVADADTLLKEERVDAGRVRVLLEGRHEHVTPSGNRVAPFLEAGMRYDLGEGLTGAGVEVGGGIRVEVPTIGVTLEGRGRGMIGHADYTEWGASGLVRVDPGASGQGLAVSLAPTYGQTASGLQRLWDQGIPGSRGRLNGLGPPNGPQAPVGRVQVEVGYGLLIQDGRGVFTPYGAATLSETEAQRYRLGGRVAWASGWHLSVEGVRQEPRGPQPAAQGGRVQIEWRF